MLIDLYLIHYLLVRPLSILTFVQDNLVVLSGNGSELLTPVFTAILYLNEAIIPMTMHRTIVRTRITSKHWQERTSPRQLNSET